MTTVDPNKSSPPTAEETATENSCEVVNASSPMSAIPVQSTLAGSGALVPSIRSVNLPKIIPFNELCRCGDEIWIEYEKQIYRLRKTKQGKLILTK